MVTIQNIVLTTALPNTLNLDDVYLKLPNTAQYNHQRFPGIVFRLPQATLLIFRSGKIVCVGAKTIQEGENTIKAFIQILKMENSMLKIKPELFVGSANLGFRIDLCKFYEMVNGKCMYEVELFPGLVYKFQNVTFLLFTSGKMILTGAKHKHELHIAYKIVSTMLERCQIK